MQELRKYYARSLLAYAVAVAIGASVVPTYLTPWLGTHYGAQHWSTWVADILTARWMVVVILAAGEWLIRNWLWKQTMAKFDIGGVWKGTTTYTTVRIGPAREPTEAVHRICFEQDCLHLAVKPTASKGYVNWGSLAVEQPDSDTVRYAYWVNYDQKPGFPERAIGYEELKVVEWHQGGRPKKMRGVFHHCAQGDEPVFSGRVEFLRAERWES